MLGLAANQPFIAVYQLYVNGKFVLDGISERGIANGSGVGTITQKVVFHNLYMNKNDTVTIKLLDIYNPTTLVPLTGWTYTQKTNSAVYNDIHPTTWGMIS